MKRYQKYIAGLLTVCLTTSATFYYADSKSAKATTPVQTSNLQTQTVYADKKAVKTASNLSAKKSEMVYVFANADGSIDHTLVSAYLKNPDALSSLNDFSNLKQIENVKGRETFTLNENQLIWAADGADIYYQGISKEEPPVSVKLNYFLDGTEISPEELAGKSGKVTIRFDYTNHLKQTSAIDGKTEELFVPYLAVSTLFLDLDQFANIEVTNGTLVSDGNHGIVLCAALPGMTENLQLDDSSLLPEYAEITADVADFSLLTTVTVITNDLFSSLLSGDFDVFKDLSASILSLGEAADQLQDGSKTLYEGIGSLLSGTTGLQDGIYSLSSGAGSLASGTKTLAEGTKSLNQGAKTLEESITVLDTGLSNASAGAAALTDGVSSALEGCMALKQGGKELNTGAKTLVKGIEDANDALSKTITANEQVLNELKQFYETTKSEELQSMISTLELTIASQKQITASMTNGKKGLKDGASSLVSGTDSLVNEIDSFTDGLSSLTFGSSDLAEALTKLTTGSHTLKEGASSLTNAASKIAAGAEDVNAGSGKLTKGITALQSGSDTLINGTKELLSGSKKLNDGMTEFNQTGIQKLTDVFQGDMELLSERLSAMIKLAKENNTFSGITDEMDGSVCFLIKTAEIKK